MPEELTLRSAIEFAIKTERQGAKLYGWLAKLFGGHAELGETFAGLARDETVHGDRFAALVAELSDDRPVGVEQRDYVRALLDAEVFFLFRNIERIQQRDDALERALQLEKSTLLRYEAMRELLGAHPILEQIIAEERRHVVQIMKHLMTGARLRGLDDEYP